MSNDTTAFEIAPLHRLSHRRLLLAEERERRMAAHFEDRFGEEATEIVRRARRDHPPLLGPSRPEDLLGPEGPAAGCDPHDFFEDAAGAQLLREAAVLAALLDHYGDEIEVEARLCSYDHGWEVGERIAGSRGSGRIDAEEAFDLLADNFPSGTACRPAIHLRSASADEAVWDLFDTDTLSLWEEAGIPPRLMSSVNAFWCKGFGEALRADGSEGLDFRAGHGLADGEAHDEGRFLRARSA